MPRRNKGSPNKPTMNLRSNSRSSRAHRPYDNSRRSRNRQSTEELNARINQLVDTPSPETVQTTDNPPIELDENLDVAARIIASLLLQFRYPNSEGFRCRNAECFHPHLRIRLIANESARRERFFPTYSQFLEMRSTRRNSGSDEYERNIQTTESTSEEAGFPTSLLLEMESRNPGSGEYERHSRTTDQRPNESTLTIEGLPTSLFFQMGSTRSTRNLGNTEYEWLNDAVQGSGSIATAPPPLSADEVRCAICQDTESEELSPNLMSINCGHNFHTTCLMTWVSRSNRCPMCRSEITSRPISPLGNSDFMDIIYNAMGRDVSVVFGPRYVKFSRSDRTSSSSQSRNDNN